MGRAVWSVSRREGKLENLAVILDPGCHAGELGLRAS